ncbi:hypothetical protein [Halolamina salifodinae]|uniref:Uncharacterized protein YjeT (DUF2065 family) n=1 Tax=Halolamina salifodinae TaxID=1202767 RepID=A0A8T4GTJ9_9EURY|nr:hypothetical protein [Halolamina salifodinae]MBP1986421.1 uncharacterized protein YjeT (DUF2065 family) [Halolamina salifodinae]
MREGYVAMGLVFVALGLLMMAYPRRLGRFRNRGAVDSEPTSGLKKQIRYLGGPLVLVLGAWLTVLALSG